MTRPWWKRCPCNWRTWDLHWATTTPTGTAPVPSGPSCAMPAGTHLPWTYCMSLSALSWQRRCQTFTGHAVSPRDPQDTSEATSVGDLQPVGPDYKASEAAYGPRAHARCRTTCGEGRLNKDQQSCSCCVLMAPCYTVVQTNFPPREKNSCSKVNTGDTEFLPYGKAGTLQRSGPTHFSPHQRAALPHLSAFCSPTSVCWGVFPDCGGSPAQEGSCVFCNSRYTHLSWISESFWKNKTKSKTKQNIKLNLSPVTASSCLVVTNMLMWSTFWLGVFARLSIRCKIKIMILFRSNENKNVFICYYAYYYDYDYGYY